MGGSLVRRILLRLEQAEWRETNPHLQADYRIAWITVLNASRGHPDPHVAACYTVLGLHPDKVWPAIVARRKVLLGPEFDSFFPELASPKLPPKKPPQSVRLAEKGRDARKLDQSKRRG